MAERGTGQNARKRAASQRSAPLGRATETQSGTGITVAPARQLAFDLLLRVEVGRDHSDELLRSTAMERLTRSDRNLCTALVLGVLRWQIALDGVLRPLLTRPEQRLASEVTVVLRLGAMQLLHMDRIPPHAALSESVELCRGAGHAHATGMVNAVLRRLATEREALKGLGVPLWETTSAFAQRLGHPTWLAERWVRQYGRAAALQICSGGQQEPGPGTLFSQNFVRGGDVGAAPGGWDAADAEDLSSPEKAGTIGGATSEMDDGSRLIAELAAVAKPDAGRVWDCCAAPGGKTMILAARLPRASILATDVSQRRMRAMKARLGMAGPEDRIHFAVAAAEALSDEEGLFDLVLCDAPCSGTGTLARNPEIRHRLSSVDLEPQAARQRRLLGAALRRLAPGGRVVYSTCSLEVEECENVVDAVLAELSEPWRRVSVEDLVNRLRHDGGLRADVSWERIAQGEVLRTLPGRDACDGFFAVVLERGSSPLS